MTISVWTFVNYILLTFALGTALGALILSLSLSIITERANRNRNHNSEEN